MAINYLQNIFQEKLPASAHLANGMGMTETHSFITMPAPGTAWQSNGKIVNTFFYKVPTYLPTYIIWSYLCWI